MRFGNVYKCFFILFLMNNLVISQMLTFPLVILILWSLVWKLIALWKSARNNHLVWFIIIGVFNTIGILPIIYIFFFSKRNSKKSGKNIDSKKHKKK